VDPDTSQLDGLWMRCLEGCGLCCLCQPELVGDENKVFSQDSELRKGITKRSITGQKGKNYSLKLKGGKGSCFFLRDRICAIYKSRPFYCNLFPIHIHLGDRAQVVANHSCRGINWDGDGIAMSVVAEEAMNLTKEYGFLEDLKIAQDQYDEFNTSFLMGDEELRRESLQNFALKLLEDFGFQDTIRRFMAYSSITGDAPSEVTSLPPFLEALGSPDVTDAAFKGALDTFQSNDLTKLPVWTDEDLNWIVCRIVGNNNTVECCVMGDDGGLKIVNKVILKDVGLKKIEEPALERMMEYARLVIKRDLTYGYSAYLQIVTQGGEDDEDNDPFLKVYLGSLGTILLDFWWRTSLIAQFGNKRTIDLGSAEMGICAYDMDFLDLPSLGGFI